MTRQRCRIGKKCRPFYGPLTIAAEEWRDHGWASFMRVDAKSTSAPLRSAGARSAAAGTHFSLDGTGLPAKAAGPSAAAPLATLDALIAVQAEVDPAERRRRSLARGRELLDMLDRLKAALLSGRVDAKQLEALSAQLSARQPASGDSGLDEVLAHIELRAEIELAKRRFARG
jgi:hypothetical protein